jgi:hypothetical protein
MENGSLPRGAGWRGPQSSKVEHEICREAYWEIDAPVIFSRNVETGMAHSSMRGVRTS